MHRPMCLKAMIKILFSKFGLVQDYLLYESTVYEGIDVRYNACAGDVYS